MLAVCLATNRIRGEKSKLIIPAINNIETERTPMVENRGGSELKPNEYEVISTNGAITRPHAPIPAARESLRPNTARPGVH